MKNTTVTKSNAMGLFASSSTTAPIKRTTKGLVNKPTLPAVGQAATPPVTFGFKPELLFSFSHTFRDGVVILDEEQGMQALRFSLTYLQRTMTQPLAKSSNQQQKEPRDAVRSRSRSQYRLGWRPTSGSLTSSEGLSLFRPISLRFDHIGSGAYRPNPEHRRANSKMLRERPLFQWFEESTADFGSRRFPQSRHDPPEGFCDFLCC